MREMRIAATELVERVRAAGAAEAEVLLQDVERWSIGGRGAGLHRTRVRRVHVRAVLEGGRCGAAVMQVPNFGDGAERVVRRAIAAARVAPPAEGAGPAPRLDVPDRGLSIHDPRHARLVDRDRLAVLEDAEASLRDAAPGAVAWGFSYHESLLRRAFATSRGIDGAESGTRFRLRGEARTERAEAAIEIVSRHFSDVASRPVGVELARLLDVFGRPAELPRDPRPIALAPPAVAELLPAILPAFCAELVQEGASLARLGERLARPAVHVIDDATLPGALETRAFDGRGVSPVPVPLLREGVVSSFYRGVRRARLDGLRPTGHEHADGTLWPGNVVVRPGSRSRNMIFPSLGVFALVERLDAPPVVDLRTGAIELRCRPVVATADGPRGSAGPRVLRSTVAELLGAVTHVLSDHERHGRVDTPTWVLDGPWFEED